VTPITLLSGGVGGSKLALGFYSAFDPAALAVIANTGDDIELFGLRICPDCDTLAYTLAGKVDPDRGWGAAAETWLSHETLGAFGVDNWFRLGDRDLGLHLYRAGRLRAGDSLEAVTQGIASAFGLKCRLLPMCHRFVPTYVRTEEGEFHLQEYLVRRRCEPRVLAVRYSGIDQASPAAGVLEAIRDASLLVIAPSNPYLSVGPILAVPGVREAVMETRALRVAVSPIVGGRALKGPLAKMMTELGHEVRPLSVARMYTGLVDIFVVDEQDASEVDRIRALGMGAIAMPTVMEALESKRDLARRLVGLVR
jgi:LPPG:FO 2-phospho-L-lactate transferase